MSGLHSGLDFLLIGRCVQGAGTNVALGTACLAKTVFLELAVQGTLADVQRLCDLPAVVAVLL